MRAAAQNPISASPRLPVALIFCAAALAGCGEGEVDGPPVTNAAEAPLLPLRSIAWKGATVDVGKVAAVAESEGTIAVFSDLGVSVMAGGVVAGSDNSIKTWSSASPIPSADGRGSWIVGIDAEGKVHRLRGDASLEDVSDRYGLLGKKVKNVAALGELLVGFGYEGGLAVADGSTVTFFADGSCQQFAAGGKRVATVAPEGVKSFDPVAKSMVLYPLEGARHVAVDPRGRLVVATARAIYVEHEAGTLKLRHKETDDVHGVAVSGTRVWFAAGTELGTIDDSGVSRSKGANVAQTAKLLPASNGEVWTLSDGALGRWGVDEAGGENEKIWNEQIRPIFERACAKCHLPGGTAGIDLSSYRTWAAHVASIEDRVVVRKQMPPAGNELSEADRASIAKWVADQKK